MRTGLAEVSSRAYIRSARQAPRLVRPACRSLGMNEICDMTLAAVPTDKFAALYVRIGPVLFLPCFPTSLQPGPQPAYPCELRYEPVMNYLLVSQDLGIRVSMVFLLYVRIITFAGAHAYSKHITTRLRAHTRARTQPAFLGVKLCPQVPDLEEERRGSSHHRHRVAVVSPRPHVSVLLPPPWCTPNQPLHACYQVSLHAQPANYADASVLDDAAQDVSRSSAEHPPVAPHPRHPIRVRLAWALAAVGHPPR